jgi:GT2 family glycosyltransferase
MYGEDQLWCEQVKNLGYRVVFYSGTTILHIGSASTDIKKQLNLRNTRPILREPLIHDYFSFLHVCPGMWHVYQMHDRYRISPIS